MGKKERKKDRKDKSSKKKKRSDSDSGDDHEAMSKKKLKSKDSESAPAPTVQPVVVTKSLHPVTFPSPSLPLTELPLSSSTKAMLKSQHIKIKSPLPFPLPLPLNYLQDPSTPRLLPPDLESILSKTLQSSNLTTIQRVFIPLTLSPSLNLNYHIISPTGTGKTLTFAFGLLSVLQKNKALILCPTRELGKQVFKVLKSVWKQKNQTCILTTGGEVQTDIPSSTNLLIGTVGRTLDQLKMLPRFCEGVSHVVMDECDVLASKNFKEEVEEIFNLVGGKEGVKVWGFSATGKGGGEEPWWGGGVRVRVDWIDKEEKKVEEKVEVVEEVVKEEKVEIVKEEKTEKEEKAEETVEPPTSETTTTTTSETPTTRILSSLPPHATQIIHCTAPHKRERKLIKILTEIMKPNPNLRQKPRCMIFFDTIAELKSVSNFLERTRRASTSEIPEIPVHATLHSSMHQSIRTKTITNFKALKLQLLLCTDVVGRGIDVKNLGYVILYDFPGLEGWVHRSGRVGRGKILKNKEDAQMTKGVVYGFFDRKLRKMAPDVVKMLEDAKQWVDPNLKELCGGSKEKKEKKKRDKQEKQQKQDEKVREKKEEEDESEIEFEDDGDLAYQGNAGFKYLNHGNKLKRAENVSDAEDSDGE